MAKTIVGIDIGSSQLKLAVCSGGTVRKMVAEDMPDNMVSEGRVVSPETMAEFIKKTASKARIGAHSCAVVLPSALVFTRTMTIPPMKREHLVLNLPYEFRDFITQEKDKYFYDYALMDTIYGEDEQPQEFELIAAATLKETIKGYTDMFRKAGLRLITAIPEELCYMNLIRHVERREKPPEEREYCFIDIGHTATRLHIFKGIKLQASRVMELGVQMLDLAIMEQHNIDEHIARVRKRANMNNVLFDQACLDTYASISIEIMRAINFHRFNSPDSDLQEVFLCGGGARVEPMVSQLAADIGMPVRMLSDLLPNSSGGEDLLVCQTAIGSAMQ